MSIRYPVSGHAKKLSLSIVKEMLVLSTSGLGLVVMEPYLPQGSTIISLGIYASVVTILAVAVTLQLTKLQKRLELKAEKNINDQSG